MNDDEVNKLLADAGLPEISVPTFANPDTQCLYVIQNYQKGELSQDDAMSIMAGLGNAKAPIWLDSMVRQAPEWIVHILPECLDQAWTGWNPLDGAHRLSQARWIELFRQTGFMISANPQPPLTPGPGSVPTLFRGAIADRARGMSWSANREVAAKFAKRYGGSVFEAHDVPGAAVLAITYTREEDEYVVDPAKLPSEFGQRY